MRRDDVYSNISPSLLLLVEGKLVTTETIPPLDASNLSDLLVQ